MNDQHRLTPPSGAIRQLATRIPTPLGGARLTPLSMRPIALKDGDLATPIGLLDFMLELGPLLQLPPKPSAAAPAKPPRIGGKRAGTRTRVGLPLLAFAALAIWAFSNAPRMTRVDVPDALLGEWETSHPKYPGRRVAFVPGQLILALGERQPAHVFTIRSLTAKSFRDTTWYDLEYLDDKTPTQFRFRFVRDPVPRLMLANPPDVLWSRVPLPVQTVSPGD